MNILQTDLDGVLVIIPEAYKDQRGYFMETYQKERYNKIGVQMDFVQDNLSFSKRGTLRGLHYQYPKSQAKLIQVLQGEIFDVVTDIRPLSSTFGQWIGEHLSDKNKKQLFIPEGFAHGFCVLSETAMLYYKCSDFYAPEFEGGILWSDPDLSIEWPVDSPIVSNKDSKLPYLNNISHDRLPTL
jgi:dTDP-4-dehydrorhamnose 3,5-epimerase